MPIPLASARCLLSALAASALRRSSVLCLTALLAASQLLDIWTTHIIHKYFVALLLAQLCYIPDVRVNAIKAVVLLGNIIPAIAVNAWLAHP